MTGPQHYRAAERLLRGDSADMAEAAVHATLALAAAVVDAATMQRADERDSAWAEVAS